MSYTPLDITEDVFGGNRYFLPAAFGDFNSDKLTDLIVIQEDGVSVEVLLASSEKPFLRSGGVICRFNHTSVESIVPGDFDGDGHMDLLVVGRQAKDKKHKKRLYIQWGDGKSLKCQNDDNDTILILEGQPLVLDYDGDMIHDIFGVDYNGDDPSGRKFWIFHTDRKIHHSIVMDNNATLSIPNSHSYIDLNQDFTADLLLTADDGYEYWIRTYSGFELNKTTSKPDVRRGGAIGQSFFMDFDLDGRIDHLVPLCDDVDCFNSSVFVYLGDKWINLDLDLKDIEGNKWSFVHPSSTQYKYLDTLTLRVGDYNLDGYPDIIATLIFNGMYKIFLLENFECKACPLKRKLSLGWSYFYELNSTIMGTFYDVNENGVLDAILVKQGPDRLEAAAIRNVIEYDAYFLKVLVTSSRCHSNCSTPKGLAYGTNLPGPMLCYKTYANEGKFRESCVPQLPQSSHFALQLPYALFGLGRMPNFVETLQVGVSEGKYHEWTQIIPNSQVVIVPPVNGDKRWKAKLFVTPSRGIMMTAIALGGLIVFLSLLVFLLHKKERKEDRIEKQQEAHKFHFDAM
nr:EOG090X03KG [Artemia franciscana]